MRTAVINGNKSQWPPRARRLRRAARWRAVATDIAARGLDVAQLPLVVNYDLPLVPRTTFTASAGLSRAGCPTCGLAVSPGDRQLLAHPAPAADADRARRARRLRRQAAPARSASGSTQAEFRHAGRRPSDEAVLYTETSDPHLTPASVRESARDGCARPARCSPEPLRLINPDGARSTRKSEIAAP